MNLNEKETYVVFRALLYRPFKIAGTEELLSKMVKEHPEWQRHIDREIANNKKVER